MANDYLWKSSIFFGSIHFLFMIFWNTRLLLIFIYAVGILTSIWNHGTTSDLAKWADRIWISLGSLVDFYSLFIMDAELAISGTLILMTAVFFFAMAKKFEKKKKDKERDLYHSISHALATIVHLGLLCL
jgi:hypothetical protein